MADDDTDTPDRSAVFRAMADRIDLNAGQDFGGAVVIVPPTGEPVEMLLLDNAQHAAMFWSTVKTRADIALAEANEVQHPQSFGGRR